MLSKVIILTAITISYIMIGALSTTNIIRLLKGNELSILSSACKCSNCGGRITVLMQLPIISYIILRGKCKYCKQPIPMQGLFLELLIPAGMMLISALFKFSFLGITLSFAFYEIVRIVFIVIFGKRDNHFVLQYIIAVFALIPVFLIIQFIALLYRVV